MIPATVPYPISTSPNSSDHLPAWIHPTVRCRYESEEARLVLRQNGLANLHQLFALADQSLHSHKGRAVSCVDLVERGGSRSKAFVKLNWGRRRLIPRWTDVKTGQAFQSLPAREWHGIEHLRNLGLLVPERLALVQSGWLLFQAAVIIKRVPPRHSVDDLIRLRKWNRLAQDTQHAILEGMVSIMQRIHEAGLGWRGTCTRHFFPERTANGDWQFWLIDCEGVHRNLTPRAIQRDYRKLHRALEISGAKPETLRCFEKLTDRAQLQPKNPTPRPQHKNLLAELQPKLKPSL